MALDCIKCNATSELTQSLDFRVLTDYHSIPNKDENTITSVGFNVAIHWLELNGTANYYPDSRNKPHGPKIISNKTSKTEVLQTPSATEVNLAQGVVRGFEFLKIF